MNFNSLATTAVVPIGSSVQDFFARRAKQQVSWWKTLALFREKLSPDDDFFKALGIDSLQTLDLLTKLENHFHVELPDYELQGVSDFRTLADKIQARL